MTTAHCPQYENHQCKLISEFLGWDHGCPTSICDQCLALGGPSSEKAAAFRADVSKKWISNVIASIHKQRPSTLEALKKHMSSADWAALAASPEGRACITKQTSWNTVKPTWEKAEAFIKSQLSKGITSKRVELTVKNQRHISCFGTNLNGDKVAEPCSALTLSDDKQHHFCNSCGCGDKAIAHLDSDGYSKLDYPYLECPRRRPGFSNEIDGVVFDARGGGLGDVLAMFWLAEGWRAKGKQCAFYTGGDVNKNMLLKMFGQLEAFDPTGALPMGGNAPYYHYEVSVDRGRNNRLDVWSSQLPDNPAPIKPHHHVNAELRKLAREEIEKRGRPFVMLFPFAQWNPRQWPISHWLDLAWTLNHHGIKCAALADNSKLGDLQSFPFFYYGQGLDFVAAMMLEADLVVTNDSGPGWLASTLGVKTIALMGPTSNLFTKCPNTMELSQDSLACTGCHFDHARGFRAACDRMCQSLMLLPSDTVVQETLKCLENPTYIHTFNQKKQTSSQLMTPVELSMSISTSSVRSSWPRKPHPYWKQVLGKVTGRSLLQKLYQRMAVAWSSALMQTKALSIKRSDAYLKSRVLKLRTSAR